MKTKKTICILTAVMLCAAMLLSAGCASKPKTQSGSINNGGTSDDNGSTLNGSVVDGKIKYSDGVIGGRTDYSEEFPISDYAIGGIEKRKDSVGYTYDGIAEAVGDYDISSGMPYVVEPGHSIDSQITAGTLTAGAIRDLDDLGNWIDLWEEQDWSNIRKTRGLYADNIIYVKVSPLTAVTLSDNDTVVYSAVSDIYGKAALVFPDKYRDQELTLAYGQTKTAVKCTSAKVYELESEVQAVNAAKLDLMLMIDTTGSMGDELEYIKVELKDMIARVRAEQNIDIRLSVNFYRDEGDEYVVKYYDFRGDIDECVEIMSEQYASGGGDYPEAVHTAINNVLQHNWRDDAVKLCFFVLDAPPHAESEIQGINADMIRDVTAMAKAGIRYIPVVSSGADVEVESLMRSFAAMTGGTYIFLTNHSGIGGDHQTPTDTQYEIEPLNDCMVRVIKDYLFAK